MTGLLRNTVAKWLHGKVDDPPKYRRSEQPNMLKAATQAHMQTLAANPERGRAYLQDPKVKYAA